jgi:hypothetical protein
VRSRCCGSETGCASAGACSVCHVERLGVLRRAGRESVQGREEERARAERMRLHAVRRSAQALVSRADSVRHCVPCQVRLLDVLAVLAVLTLFPVLALRLQGLSAREKSHLVKTSSLRSVERY